MTTKSKQPTTYQQSGLVANAYHTINNMFASTRLASEALVNMTAHTNDAAMVAASKASEAIKNAKFN